MVPGLLDTSWTGLEDSEVSGGTAHHERLVLHSGLWDAIYSYLEVNLWNFPQHFKRIFHFFLLLNYILVIFILPVFLFCSLALTFCCYLYHVAAYSNAQGLNIWFSAQNNFCFCFSPPYMYCSNCTHTQWAGKKWKPLSFFCKKTNKQRIRIRHCTSWTSTMAIFFFCVSDRPYTQERKNWGFPLGES